MPISVAALPAALAYSGDEGVAKWEGYVVASEAAFRAFMIGPVAERARDAEFGRFFESELRGLATTGMATRHLARFLDSVRDETSWEIGEAFAESVLALDGNREVTWPWNHVRDRRTSETSLTEVRAALRESGEGPWQKALGDLGPTDRTVWSIIEAEGVSREGTAS